MSGGGGGRHRHNTNLYNTLAQCKVGEEHRGRGNPEEATGTGWGWSGKTSWRRGPFTWAVEEEWAVAGHCKHECDGCFKGSKGCIELEGIGKGFVEMALKAEWNSSRENDIPGLLWKNSRCSKGG